MQAEKPKITRTYITAVDANGESPSKSITIYHATPEQVVERLRELVSGKKSSRQSRRDSTAAA